MKTTELDATIRRFHAPLQDGREVHFFVNCQTGLVVVDVVAAEGTHGTEILCRVVPPAWDLPPEIPEDEADDDA